MVTGAGLVSESPVEIERVWLLSNLPELPANASRWRIRQGYLSPGDPREAMIDDPETPPTTGRIRAIEAGWSGTSVSVR